MIKFSQDKVLLLHQLIAQETGSDAGDSVQYEHFYIR